jgi:hypothetical protein
MRQVSSDPIARVPTSVECSRRAASTTRRADAAHGHHPLDYIRLNEIATSSTEHEQ